MPICPNCSIPLKLSNLEHKEDSWYIHCPLCDDTSIMRHFLDDVDKMKDLSCIPKRQFLDFYSYISEDEYECTRYIALLKLYDPTLFSNYELKILVEQSLKLTSANSEYPLSMYLNLYEGSSPNFAVPELLYREAASRWVKEKAEETSVFNK